MKSCLCHTSFISSLFRVGAPQHKELHSERSSFKFSLINVNQLARCQRLAKLACTCGNTPRAFFNFLTLTLVLPRLSSKTPCASLRMTGRTVNSKQTCHFLSSRFDNSTARIACLNFQVSRNGIASSSQRREDKGI